MEAMAAGLPVVSTRIAGIPELVEDGRGGLLVAPGRADQLADALIALADDPQLRRRLGDHARETVRREFNLRTIGPALRDLFAERAG
jgi:glycosyltransferase involved in cell wall biosynthesis